MARRGQPEPRRAELTRDQLRAGIERLLKRVEELRAFDPDTVDQQFNWPPLQKLKASIEDGLLRTFGENTIEYNRYRRAAAISTGPVNMLHATPIEVVRKHVAESRNAAIAVLEQAIESLAEQLAEMPEAVVGTELAPETSRSERLSDRVFIVHGHDGEARESVARFVGGIGLEPVILHEKPNEGRTLIEKFETHGDVGFAVVLLTPDDVGGPKEGELKPRARQNVVLELGYFTGKLGRQRVCALRRGDLEIPSDYVGVVYHELDTAGAWKVALAKELQAAGYGIDWNKVMGK